MSEQQQTPAQILKKIRALEIKTRGLVETARRTRAEWTSLSLVRG